MSNSVKKAKRPKPLFVKQLSQALRERLKGAEVKHVHVRGRRYRFAVIWRRFGRMGHPERQRIVWDIAADVVKGMELWNVSMILALESREVLRQWELATRENA